MDGKLYGNLEHAIEKANSEKLFECIPNIGLACIMCNQTFKRIGERKRKLPKVLVEQYENESLCGIKERKQCVVPCNALRNLQKQYNALPEGQFILQPMGVYGTETGSRLALQYDILKMEFQPADLIYTYSKNEKAFIEMHIKRFRLNDPKYRTRQLYNFIKSVIDNQGKIPHYEYNNWIVEQFRDNISNKSQEDILKICKSIYCIVFSKM